MAKRTMAALLVLLAVMLGVTWFLAPTTSLQLTNDASTFRAGVSAYGLSETRASLVVDFFLPLLYVPLGMAWLRWAQRKVFVVPVIRELGRSLTMILLVAGAADIFENSTLLVLLGAGEEIPSSYPEFLMYLSTALAYVKWVGIASVVAYVAPATAFDMWKRMPDVLPWRLRIQDLDEPRRASDGP